MAPITSKKAVKKAGKKNIIKADKKKRKKCRTEKYAIYIQKVIKQFHPETGISSEAMSIVNTFVIDIFKTALLAHCAKSSTLTSWDIQTAVRRMSLDGVAKLVIEQFLNILMDFLRHK